ncbi:MAG: SagB/ThcOx family dehydrogenase [Spirochaetes bacterium]|nr:SagB/ThcOx family dehydrogenase [Spirochaetota bacterium]
MFENGRQFMKSQWTGEPMTGTDQLKGLPMPPFENDFDEKALIPLPDPKAAALKKRDIVQVFAERESRRKLGAAPLSLSGLSFILWASAGMREIKGGRIFRTVPSAGSRHPFETFFYADKIEGLQPGLYRYIATKNAVLPVSFREGLKDELSKRVLNQWFDCALAVFWVFNAYRCEWRYTHHSHKVATVDAGHIGQNAYLAAEALGIGCCTIGAYKQDIDAVLGVDGENEFCVYAGVFGAYE